MKQGTLRRLMLSARYLASFLTRQDSRAAKCIHGRCTIVKLLAFLRFEESGLGTSALAGDLGDACCSCGARSDFR